MSEPFRILSRDYLPWLLALCLVACGGPIGTLRPGIRLEGTLVGGETKFYSIPCEEGQVIDLVVDQRGVDAVVALKDPNGQVLSEVDGFFGASGRERILELIPFSGTCMLEVRAPDDLSQVGQFAVWIERQQSGDQSDLQKVAAARIYWEGFRLEMAGELFPAIEKYAEALARWVDLESEEWQSVIHYTIGQIYANKVSHNDTVSGDDSSTTVLAYGQPHEPPRQYEPKVALEHLKASLKLSKGNPGLEARTYLNLGDIYHDLLQLDLAQASFESALPIWIRLDDKANQASTLNNLGLTHKELGELHSALRNYDAATLIWKELGNRYEEAIALNNRGRCYASLNRVELAEADLERAINIWRDLDASDAMLAMSLTALGEIYGKKGDFEEAHAQLSQALELRGSDRLMQAVTRLAIGAVKFAQGNHEAAGEHYQRALEVFREFGDRRGESKALFRLGELREVSKPEEALGFHNQARLLSIEIGSRELTGLTLFGMARAERNRGNLMSAKRYIEAAIEKVEFLRNKATSNDLRSVFFAGKQHYYSFYVDLLMELADERPEEGYDALALSVSERSRARSLLDMLHDSGVDLRRGHRPDLLEEELRLERAIEAKYIEREEMLSFASSGSQAAETVTRELMLLLRALEDIRAEILLHQPTYSGFTQPRPISAKDIQNNILDDDTILLEYHLGEPQSYLFVVSNRDLASFRLLGRSALEAKAQHLYDILTDSSEETTLNRGRLYEALEGLSQEILLPAADIIENKRLLIVAGGALQYIPFSALPVPASEPDNYSRLVDGHEITFLPSASILETLRKRFESRPKASRNLAIVADPVFFNDPRRPKSQVGSSRTRDLTSGSGHYLERLAFSRNEAEEILAQSTYSDNMLALGFDATKEQVLDDALSNYRFVHLATHSIVDTEFPDMSSLVFSRVDRHGREIDGLLRVYDIYRLSLRADMVVLSACKTARGKELRGEGLVGWTHGFMYSGANRVLVSLWDVDDEATAELMRLVYGNIFQRGLSPASALRRAQSTLRQKPRWREPYFWAGFVLQGEYL